MLRRHATYVLIFRLASDILMISSIWILVFYIRFYCGLFPVEKAIPDFKQHVKLVIPVAIACYIGCRLAGLYKPKRLQNMFAQSVGIFRAVILSGLFIIFFFYYTKSTPYSRVLLVLFFILMFIGLMFSHLLTMKIFRILRAKGYNLRHYAIIGAGQKGQQLVNDIEQAAWLGLKCVFFVDDDLGYINNKIARIPVYGPIEKLKELVRTHTIDEVYLALGGPNTQKAYSILEDVQASGVTVRIIPDWGNLISTSSVTTTMIGSQVLFCASDSPLNGLNALLKEIFDRIMALVLLILFAVPMILIAIMIKLTSRGKVFYAQTRIGLDQEEFKILKFRSMAEETSDDNGAEWSTSGNPRRTWIGKYLRRLSLDELPQLINVLKGDMSLVGPRPEQPVFIKQFSEEYKKYMFRHKVKAGMTGWAQVNGLRGDTSIRKRLLYDLYYVKNWSWWLDMWILLQTPWQIIKGKNAY